MVERKRSKDGKQEAQEIADGAGGQAKGGQQGGAGGRLARQIGTEDELKRVSERPAGATRVTKSDEKEKQKSDRQG